MEKKWRGFSNGAWLSGPKQYLTDGFVRRNRGLSSLSAGSAKSRPGSSHLRTHDAHSLVYFYNGYHYGVTTYLYKGATSIRSGLSGNRLSFMQSGPTSGRPDQLFVAGGGSLFKVDYSGSDTAWGINAPSGNPQFAYNDGDGVLDGTYQYAVTFANSDSGSRSNPVYTEVNEVGEDSTRLLLHFESDFDDSSAYNHVPVAGGSDPTHIFIEASESAVGTASLRNSSEFENVDAAGALVVPQSSYLNPLGERLTIEFWWKFNTGGDQLADGTWPMFSQSGGGNTLEIYLTQTTVDPGEGPDEYTAGFHAKFTPATGTGFDLNNESTSIYPMADQTWIHVALVRGYGDDDNAWGFFINGTAVDSAYLDRDLNILGPLTLLGGIDVAAGATWVQDSMDEFRYTIGLCQYLGNFTPSTAPFTTSTAANSGTNATISLSNIPVSTDAQVDTVEIWRTLSNQETFFLLTTLANGTTTYLDNAPDTDLLDETLEVDNIPPYSWFDDVCGPYNASCFWITRTQNGKRGYLYYSPIGRMEAVQGYLDLASDGDGLQKIFIFAGSLYVLSESKLFQITGENPYYARELDGVPGTTKPFTVAVTPYGVMWEAHDGVVLYNGGMGVSYPGLDAIKPIFRGFAVDGNAAFGGSQQASIATYARGEYVISNGTDSWALDITNQRWRDLGVALDCLYYREDSDVLGVTLSGEVLSFESPGSTTDNNTAISFDLKTGGTDIPVSSLKRLRIEANSNGQTLTAYAGLNDASVAELGTLSTATTRRVTTFELGNLVGDMLEVELTGSLTAEVEIFDCTLEYTPIILKYVTESGAMDIPARWSADRLSLVFDLPDESRESLNQVRLFERLFYDLGTTGSTQMSASIGLQLINETELTLGNITFEHDREIGEININRLGRFERLELTYSQATAQAFYRLELHSKPANSTKMRTSNGTSLS